MAAKDVITAALNRNWDMVDRALEGLDETVLARQPNAESNSIAWLLWHMSRVVDNFMNSRLRSRSLIWEADGWCEKFGMGDDPEASGAGWTTEQVAGWAAPSRETLTGYYEATKECAREYLSSLSDGDLEKSLVVPPVPEPRPVHDLLGILIFDNVVHGGQIAYLRGYYRGMGWFF